MKGIIKKLYPLTLVLFLAACSTESLKTDSSLLRFLENKSIEFEIDNEGDYRILADNEGLSKDVWIRGELNFSGSTAIREIFSVSMLINEEELASISRVLLVDNFQTRIMGSWSLLSEYIPQSDTNNYLIIYTIKACLESDDDYILQALREASEAASALEQVLSLSS